MELGPIHRAVHSRPVRPQPAAGIRVTRRPHGVFRAPVHQRRVLGPVQSGRAARQRIRRKLPGGDPDNWDSIHVDRDALGRRHGVELRCSRWRRRRVDRPPPTYRVHAAAGEESRRHAQSGDRPAARRRQLHRLHRDQRVGRQLGLAAQELLGGPRSRSAHNDRASSSSRGTSKTRWGTTGRARRSPRRRSTT